MRRKKRKDWFFDDFLRDFEEEFREIEADLSHIFEEAERRFIELGEAKNVVYGFSVHVGPDGEPKIERFSNLHSEDKHVPISEDDDYEPLVDIIEGEKDLKVVAEIPGVLKEDICLNVSEDCIEINVDTNSCKYNQRLDLPAKVVPKVACATYKNGVLDVSLTRVSETGGDFFRVNID